MATGSNAEQHQASGRVVAEDRAGLERHEGDEQFRELMAHLEQVFWIKNAADDAVFYISPAYATISGRTCQSLYDDFQTFLAAVHPDDRERVGRAMAGQRETGGYQEEYRIVRPDGTLRWIWARSYPIRDGQGRIIRFAGVGEDVTERKSLELDRARLAAIVEYSEDAIVSMSVDCIIIGWNRGAERQYGYTAEEIIGCSLSVLFPAGHYPEYLRILKSVRQGEPVASCDTLRRRKDGTLINASVNIFPIEVRNRELVGASKISRDVTAIKKLEAQFVEAQKMEVVGQFAARMAHDFNNLLSVILGTTELIMSALGPEAPLRQEVDTIQQAAERAAGLTHQLLVFSRKESAASVVLDLKDVVGSLDRMLRRLIDERIALTIVHGVDVGRVRANAGYLGQLLMNLVVNARDAMPDGGRLTIATSSARLDQDYASAHAGVTPGSYAVLTVSDTGTGMTDEVKARLFEPFFTTKPRGSGTGLGLTTCDIIVKQCGGHIDVSSEPGRGTRVAAFFPAVGEPPDASLRPPTTSGPAPRGTEALLVVEGERGVRELACSALESLGYTVLRAVNAQDGLRVARGHRGPPIRLVVSDVDMPQLIGDATAEGSQTAGPELEFVFTSAHAYDAVAHRAASAARISLLPKPYTPAQLARQVRARLDRDGSSV
jgi:two-component system cell cycle sensor histidine kinase/response regulator CckA